MEEIANIIRTKLPNYTDFAICLFDMPYNHQWHKNKYVNWDKQLPNNQFSNLKNVYGCNPLTRQMIIDLFAKGKSYDGFLCSMVWGGIGNNIKGVDAFKSVFGVDHMQEIDHIVHILQTDGAGKAYEVLYGGSIKITNVGESFYTKLLYFAGAHMTSLIPKPLILDSNMHRVYEKICSNIPNDPVEKYVDYCEKMEELKRLLLLPTAGHVEVLLFCPGIRELIFNRQ